MEVNALWYNLLAFADSLARRFHASEPAGDALLRDMRQTFLQRFWTPEGGGHLGDVWRGEGGENAPGCGPGCGSGCGLDASVRPNQIFAVSLPYPILAEDFQAQVVECVRNKLLTPYGLRTLAPDAAAYCGRYAGGPAERDGAYHQGTVCPGCWGITAMPCCARPGMWKARCRVFWKRSPPSTAITLPTPVWAAFQKFLTVPRPTRPTAA